MAAHPGSHAHAQLHVVPDAQLGVKVHVLVAATATRKLLPCLSVGAGLNLGIGI